MPRGSNERNIEGGVAQAVAEFKAKAELAPAEQVKDLALELANRIKTIALDGEKSSAENGPKFVEVIDRSPSGYYARYSDGTVRKFGGAHNR